MFFSLLSLTSCYQDLLVTLKNKVSRLHDLTKASTYYEFFSLSENCSDSEIKKAFRRMKKATPPSNLSKEQFDELVMNGYSVLGNYRKAYDAFLGDSKFIYIGESSNYKNYLIVTVIAIVCMLVFVDFVVYAFKYLKFSENVEKYKQAKKTDGKSKKELKMMNPPRMVIGKIFNRNK